jgi:hypothetical protein
VINLASTSDLIRVVTTSAATLDVNASWIDFTGSVPTPDRDNTEIASATTTTVVSSPGSGVRRSLGEIAIRNTHAATSNGVTVEHTDGTTVAGLHGATLLAGESLTYRAGSGWKHCDSTGAER